MDSIIRNFIKIKDLATQIITILVLYVWDNLMRIKNHQVAAELLEIALGTTTES